MFLKFHSMKQPLNSYAQTPRPGRLSVLIREPFFLWWILINIEIYIGQRTYSKKLRSCSKQHKCINAPVSDLVEECGKRLKRYMTQMNMTSAGKCLVCHWYYTHKLTVIVSTLHKEIKKITQNSTITGVDDLQPPPQVIGSE